MCYNSATLTLVSTTIPQRELRNKNAEVIRRVEAGEEFVVTRNGVPIADVKPHKEHSGPPRFTSTKALLSRGGNERIGVDWQSWTRDIREKDEALNDDPWSIRA